MDLQYWLLPFQFPFMQYAFLICLIVSIPTALLSCFLVMKGWALMGDVTWIDWSRFGRVDISVGSSSTTFTNGGGAGGGGGGFVDITSSGDMFIFGTIDAGLAHVEKIFSQMRATHRRPRAAPRVRLVRTGLRSRERLREVACGH